VRRAAQRFDRSNKTSSMSTLGRLGASDADFIAGRTLYEFKCFDPRSGRFTREHLFQLLGYVCMNACAPQGYHLEARGLINPRAGFVWAMSLNALCRAIGAGSFEGLLSHFRELVGPTRQGLGC